MPYACTLLLLLARRSSTQCRRRLDHLRAVPCEAPSPQALDLDHGVHVDLVLLDQPLLARLEPDRLEGVRHSGERVDLVTRGVDAVLVEVEQQKEGKQFMKIQIEPTFI